MLTFCYYHRCLGAIHLLAYSYVHDTAYKLKGLISVPVSTFDLVSIIFKFHLTFADWIGTYSFNTTFDQAINISCENQYDPYSTFLNLLPRFLWANDVTYFLLDQDGTNLNTIN